MTIITDIKTQQAKQFNGITKPVFMPKMIMEQPMGDTTKTQKIEPILSIFDVKELYDLAYAEKAKGPDAEASFKTLLAEAVKLDLAYRRQLTKITVYKDRTKMKNFNKATHVTTEGSKVA